MVPQAEKIQAIVFAEALTDNASMTTTEIDTKGFDYCDVYFRLGS